MKGGLFRHGSSAAIMLLILLPAGALVWALRWGDVPPDSATGMQEPAVLADHVRSVVLRTAGRKVWECRADQVQVSPDHRIMTAFGLQDGRIFRGGVPVLQLRAHQLRVNQWTCDGEARGEVKAWGQENLSLHTTLVRWQHRLASLVCPGLSEATYHGIAVRCRGVQYQVPRARLSCPGPVTAWNARAVMHGQRAMVELNRQTIYFQGPMELVIRKQPRLR